MQLREYRLLQRKTLQEIKEKTGVSISYLSKIENGIGHPSVKIQNMLKNALPEAQLEFNENPRQKWKEDKEKILARNKELLDQNNALIATITTIKTKLSHIEKEFEKLKDVFVF